MTPLHLGLAAQLHHEYGKRDLIETLNSHGFSVSYDDLRRFMTSVGQAEMNKIRHDTYIPHGLISRHDGGSLIQEGADNVDINCETIDGKGTFHSMARVVFQHQPNEQLQGPELSVERISLGKSKSHVLTEAGECVLNILQYKKPTQRAEPLRTPDALTRLLKMQSDTGEVCDILWVLLRSLRRLANNLPIECAIDEMQITPFWTGYNAQIADRRDTRTVASYAPIIVAKPADPPTVYTTMVRCKQMTNALGQTHSIQTMDQQLYAVAQQVKLSTITLLQDHVLRLGGFHSLCTFIATIGKLWGDGGLKALFVDSDVYAACSADMMLEGKHFHRAVRGLTLAYEAFMQLFLSEFFKWCETEEKVINASIWLYLNKALATLRRGNRDQLAQDISLLKLAFTQHLTHLLSEFREAGCSKSPTFSYWSMFLDAVHILLSNIRAEREGNWNLHLATQVAMTPYFFATNRINYARWTPVYLLDMAQLPDEVEDTLQQILLMEYGVTWAQR